MPPGADSKRETSAHLQVSRSICPEAYLTIQSACPQTVCLPTNGLPFHKRSACPQKQNRSSRTITFTNIKPDQVRKHPKSAPGGHVLGPTRYENRGKVHLVVVLKKRGFCQAPHPKQLTNSLPSLPKAPGTKTPPKRAWWACFRPHQVRKHPKNAPGRQVSGPSRYEIGGKVRQVVVLKEWLSSKSRNFSKRHIQST